MSKHSLEQEHLQDYTGILTSHNRNNGNFKMALKVEDNPVLEKSIEKIESSIELEFCYNMGLSTLFFHDINSCPNQNENCPECEDIEKKHYKFEANLERLQVGDTFRIQAALVNNKQSELPVEIPFKAYERIIVACTECWLRLDDTPEGIKKKVKIEEQRLQREREEEDRQKEKEDRRKKEEDKRKRQEKWYRLDQWLAKYPNIMKIGVAIIGATVLNQIPNIVKLWKYLYRLFVSN